MKIILVVGLCFSTATLAGSVKGSVRKNGTYVAPHQRTAPNSTKIDNYSSKGNVNPGTGKEGTKDPYAQKPLK